jgi:4a-hydroxytetrahydrobiopterin dehydratase
MERRERLADQALERELGGLEGWKVAGGKLHREYRFHDFIEAWGFMSSAALVIQQMDHHPEWSNVYGTVVVELVTHDAGGITARDVELARRMEAIATRRAAG